MKSKRHHPQPDPDCSGPVEFPSNHGSPEAVEVVNAAVGQPGALDERQGLQLRDRLRHGADAWVAQPADIHLHSAHQSGTVTNETRRASSTPHAGPSASLVPGQRRLQPSPRTSVRLVSAVSGLSPSERPVLVTLGTVPKCKSSRAVNAAKPLYSRVALSIGMQPERPEMEGRARLPGVLRTASTSVEASNCGTAPEVHVVRVSSIRDKVQLPQRRQTQQRLQAAEIVRQRVGHVQHRQRDLRTVMAPAMMRASAPYTILTRMLSANGRDSKCPANHTA